MEFLRTPFLAERLERAPVETWADRSFIWLTRLAAIAIATLLVWMVLQVGLQAAPAVKIFGGQFLLSRSWNPPQDDYGALPTIYGTLVSSALALFLAFPVGLASAIALSENFLPAPARRTLIFLIELLAAIPSVVYGLWGIYVLIPFLKPIGSWLHEHWGWIPLFSTPFIGPGMLPAGIVLAIMILPILTAIARDSLASLPPELRWGAYGVGSSRWQTIFGILIPAASSGILGGTMLALGRALGETMAVTMVIGNKNQIGPSLLAPASTIASLLANQFAEASELQRAALMYAGFILFGITLAVNVLAEWIVRRVRQ